MKYYSCSDDLNIRAIQKIFRGRTRNGLFVKPKKTDPICKNTQAYELKYSTILIIKDNDNFVLCAKNV